MSSYITKRAKELNLQLIDAKYNLTLEVTKDDVRKGIAKNSKECALSRSCRRALKDVKAAYFFRTTAWLEYDKKIVRYVLPESVQKEIVSFDRTRVMEPGIYQLSKPEMSRTLGAAHRRSLKRKGRHPGGSGKTIRSVRHRMTGIRTLLEPKSA